MSEKSFAAELKVILAAGTFADLARVAEPSLRRWRADPSYARPAEAFEALPKIVRKRFAKLKVFDSAALILAVASVGGRRVRQWLRSSG